jgi:hypothetical protein
MSSLMRLSLKEKKNIIKDLIHDKQSKFNKKVQKLLDIIQKNLFLDRFTDEVKELQKEFKQRLKTIDIHDVDYEVHYSKANQIDEEFTKKLIALKSKIISFRDQIIIARINNYTVSTDIKSIEDYLKDENGEFKVFLELVKNLDNNQYERIKALDIKDDLKLKEAKVIYLKLSYTQLIKEELQDMLEELDTKENKR